jgi:hypothetical protein
MTCCPPSPFGANPELTRWTVVRGDTSTLRVEFYEDDEVTFFDTSTWTYSSTVYNQSSQALVELETVAGEGYVDIIANADVTELWGSGYLSVVAELKFDLQVIIDSNTVWTPVIGTISVLGDVTGGTL